MQSETTGMLFGQVGGSFRDPAGQVFDDGNTILRTVKRIKFDEFMALETQGVFEKLTRRGVVVGSEDVTSQYPEMVAEMIQAYAEYEQQNGVIPVPDGYNPLVQAQLNAERGVMH